MAKSEVPDCSSWLLYPRSFGVTKASLFIVFLPLPSDCRFQSYQSVDIYRLPTPAQVVIAALEVTKVLLFMFFVLVTKVVMIASVLVTKVSLFIAFQPLPRW